MRENKASSSNKGGRGEKANSCMELNGKPLDFRSILKEVEILGSSDMTWKERKKLQEMKVVSLGGKAPKKQRLPLSIARVQMKNQKQKEQKMSQQELLLGHSGESIVVKSTTKQHVEKRRPEESVLKSSEGRFRNGVLDVKHLLRPAPAPRDDDRGPSGGGKGKKKKKGGKKNRGKKKGGGKKRH